VMACQANNEVEGKTVEMMFVGRDFIAASRRFIGPRQLRPINRRLAALKRALRISR
jgi:hypothetical protein